MVWVISNEIENYRQKLIHFFKSKIVAVDVKLLPSLILCAMFNSIIGLTPELRSTSLKKIPTI